MFQVTPSRWNPLYIHYMLQYPLNNGDGVMGPFFGELFPSFSLGTSVFDLDFCDPTKNWIQDCCFIPKPRKSPCQPDSQTKGWDIGSLSSNYLTQLIILIPTILGDGGLCNLGFGYSLTNPKYIISQMNMWISGEILLKLLVFDMCWSSYMSHVCLRWIWTEKEHYWIAGSSCPDVTISPKTSFIQTLRS